MTSARQPDALSILFPISSVIWRHGYYSPYFTGEETKAQEVYMTWQKVTELLEG